MRGSRIPAFNRRLLSGTILARFTHPWRVPDACWWRPFDARSPAQAGAVLRQVGCAWVGRSSCLAGNTPERPSLGRGHGRVATDRRPVRPWASQRLSRQRYGSRSPRDRSQGSRGGVCACATSAGPGSLLVALREWSDVASDVRCPHAQQGGVALLAVSTMAANAAAVRAGSSAWWAKA